MAARLELTEKDYYKRVEDLLKEEEPDSVFSKNVLEQMQSDGIARVFCDKDGSKTVEKILQTQGCDAASIKALLEPIVPDFNSVASDRCGSHSLEALIKAVGKMIDSGDTDTLQRLFLQGCSGIKTSLSDLLIHPYAGHVVAAVAQVLSGVYVAEHLTRSRYSREFRKAKMEREEQQKKTIVERKVVVPQNFTEMLDKLGKWTCKLENFHELLVHTCASPVLQVLLRVLVERLPERGNKMIRKILKSVKESPPGSEENEDHLPPLCTCAVGSHLMGVLMEVTSADLHQWMYESCFKDKELGFALHPVANYPLQQFMAVADPAKLAIIITQLLPHLEDVLFVGHSGVVVKVVEAGLKCPDLQQAILEALLAAFHAETEAKSCVPLFLTLTAYEVYFNKEHPTPNKRPAHILGSLMVQALLKYENPKIVAGSLVKMKIDDVVKMSCDPVSSHVIDAFLGSHTVSLRRKTKLIDKLKLHLIPLCKDKYGSRVMDAVWRNCEVSKKEILAQELLSHESELSDDFYGQIVLRNCKIAHYKRKQAVWQEREKTTEKTWELFRDILEEPAEQKKTEKGKRKRKREDKAGEEEGKESGTRSSVPLLLQDTKKRKKKLLSLFDD